MFTKLANDSHLYSTSFEQEFLAGTNVCAKGDTTSPCGALSGNNHYVGIQTGARIPISWKEGFGGPKTPISPRPYKGWKREFSVQKIPIFYVFPCRKKGIFRQKTPFSRTRGNGGFWTPKPSLPGNGDSGPCLGSGESQPLRTNILRALFQCHAEGGATKGGVSKCEQTQANADKRGETQANAEAQTQRRKRKQARANVDKRKQTLTYPPFIAVFFTPPFAIPWHMAPCFRRPRMSGRRMSGTSRRSPRHFLNCDFP